jgi:hypothetical protein
MFEFVEKILYYVGFLAIGGTLALIFFLMFAPNIVGSRTIHRQLEMLQKQMELMTEHLREIAGHLSKENEKDQEDD